MQIHELKVKKKTSRKRVGRGGKKGTYSGRGMKGQKSRSGASQSPTFEGGKTTLIQKTKKLKGFKSRNPKKLAINLSVLEAKFKDGEKVNAKSLKEKKVIRKISQAIKILSEGEITKKIIIENIEISKKAKEKIEKAGGKIEEKKEKTTQTAVKEGKEKKEKPSKKENK